MVNELTPDDISPDEIRARSLFSDYLLAHAGEIEDDFPEYCKRHQDHENALMDLARDWSQSALKSQESGEEIPPTRIEPRMAEGFVLLREIGRGGMGVVFEAEQEKPKRRVALKVVREEFVDRERIKRIELEGQVLALLKHPSIVPLYGSGRTKDGSPWFAMEYVEGSSLDRYLEEETPPLEVRLRIFLQICHAISYAHQKGVIHRDLKPSNILISTESVSTTGEGDLGRVRILDFGLARITDADISLVSMPSDAGRIVGTLAYMSPEQIRGQVEEVDQRSDVYSLGILLYEITTGRRPWDLDGLWLGEAAKRIEASDPTRPGAIDRKLRGDLDAVILKTMDQDPKRRYQSAASLADDIERHLTGLPVHAHPPSAAYQLRKLILRHKGAAASIAVFLAASLTLLIVLFAHERENASHQRQLAESQRAKADAIAKERDDHAASIRFWNNILSSPNPDQAGPGVKFVEVLDHASEVIEDAFPDQPVVEATIRRTIGNTYSGIGLFGNAEPHLVTSLRLFREHKGPSDGETLRALNFLANVLHSQKKMDEANALYEEALSGAQEALGEEHPITLTIQSNLAEALEAQGKGHEAESILRSVLEARTRILGENHPQTLFSMSHLGKNLIAHDRHAEAEPFLEEAYEKRGELLGEKHTNTLTSMHLLGELRATQGRPGEAEIIFRRLYSLRQEVLGPEHPQTLTTSHGISLALQHQGKYAEAALLLREVRNIQERVLAPDNIDIVSTDGHLGIAYKKLGRLDDALPYTEGVYERRMAVQGEEHPQTLLAANNLASLLFSLGRSDEALELIQRSLEIHERTLGKEHLQTIGAAGNLGMLLRDRGDIEGAMAIFSEQLEMMRRHYGERHVNTLNSANNLAAMIAEAGDIQEAIDLLTPYREFACREFPELEITGMILANHAIQLAQLGRYREAEDPFISAHSILERCRGPFHSISQRLVSGIVHLYTKLGDEDSAREWKLRLKESAQHE